MADVNTEAQTQETNTQTDNTAESVTNEETKQEQTTATTQEANTEKTETEDKTFKQDDVDKIVTDRLARERAKWEKEYNQKLESEKKEAERLAKMTAAEKEKAIFEKQKGDLAKKEKEIALKEMKFEAVKILSDKGLPVDFVDMLATNDADKTKENIDNFDKAFKAALSKAVDERIKASSTSPKTGTTVDLSKELEALRVKARRTGKIDDRVAYAKMKQKIEQAKINEK